MGEMKRGTVGIIAGLLLIAAALFLSGYNVWDGSRAGAETEAVLERLLPKIDEDPVPAEGRMQYVHAQQSGDGEAQPVREDRPEYPDYVLDPNREMPVITVDGKEYIGVVSVPALEMELPVFAEWNYQNLKTAPCRYMGSVYLDDMILCAHNYDQHFGRLKNLKYGDGVLFTDADGNVFHYRVTEIEMLDSTAVEQMPEGEWDLTLFTCTVGGAKRVTVRCNRE